jgi:hypothetical protein
MVWSWKMRIKEWYKAGKGERKDGIELEKENERLV